jgi:hypothetical protein
METEKCPFCGGIVRPRKGHKEITFFQCHGCGRVASFGNLIDEDKPLPPRQAIKMYRSRPDAS